MKQKTLFMILKAVVGLLLLAVVFFNIGVAEIGNVLLQADLFYFFVAFVLFFVSVTFAAANVYLMLRPFHHPSFFRLFNYFLMSNRIASLFLPGRIGEYSIIFFLKQEQIPLGMSAAAVTMDKAVTLFSSGLIALAGLLYFFGMSSALYASLILLVSFLAGIVLFSPFSRSFIKNHILRSYASRFDGFFSTFSSYYKQHRRVLALNFLITFARVVVIALSAFFMFAALGAFPSLLLIIAVGSIETISSVLPITVSGLGVKQSLGIYLYHLMGIDPAISAARYVLGFIINYGFALISLLFVKRRFEQHENPH